VCHAVDPVHNGDENASVVYIPACPATPTNKAYNKKQLAAILSGQRPPDYVEDGEVLDERTLVGHLGLDDLTVEARKAWGFDV
jgi:hypothetical protein